MSLADELEAQQDVSAPAGYDALPGADVSGGAGATRRHATALAAAGPAAAAKAARELDRIAATHPELSDRQTVQDIADWLAGRRPDPGSPLTALPGGGR